MGIQSSTTDGKISGVQTFPVERVSVASDGAQANGGSDGGSISADGRYVVYLSDASNLIPGDTNGLEDVFLFDRQTDTTTRVSVASNGAEANGNISGGSISADGRFIIFSSRASSLVPDDTNIAFDVFVFDRQTATTTRVSVASDGAQANDDSAGASISADGRFISYTSGASNLVPGDTNGSLDVFVFDQQTHSTTRVSLASDGAQANGNVTGGSISADGQLVTYFTAASNLVPGDTNGVDDVFVFDRQTGAVIRASVATDGTEANGFSSGGAMSTDGRFVGYSSAASNLVVDDTNNAVDAFVFDRQTNTTERVSIASDGTQASGSSFLSSISPDGRFVAFTSDASNLAPGDTNGKFDLFVFDRETRTTTRVDVASDGAEADADIIGGSFSGDSRFLTYSSPASNLVPGDTNGAFDVFVAQIDVGPPVDGVVKDGDDGNNLLKGTHRDDILRGHGGKDLLIGQKGNDRLDAGDGNDKIFAGKGDDTILAGAGNDRIWTGKGSDLVVFNEGDGRDKVFGFHRHGHHDGSDLVQLNVSIGDNHIDDFAELQALIASGDIGLSTQKGSLTLTFDNGDALTLGGVHALSAEDFVFA